MWIASTLGWYSIVKSSEMKAAWMIRGRARRDIENIIRAAGLKQVEPIDTPANDYRWRVIVGPVELAKVFAVLLLSISYPNFKSKIKETDQADKLWRYHEIWATMEEYQRVNEEDGFRARSKHE